MKVILENWRKYLKEQEEEDPVKQVDSPKQAAIKNRSKKLLDLIKSPYKEFVAKLQKSIKDPKFAKFLDMGLEDGSTTDDVVKVGQADIPVKDLQPTQSQIGLADSLGYLSEKAPQGAADLAKGAVKPANIGGRIITANGKYVVDGHHRWSQIYLINPEATVPAINFEVGGFLDSPEGVLKLAHLSIAAVDDDVPLKQADSATDIYKTGGKRDQIKKILSQTVSDEMAQVLAPEYRVKTKEQVIDKIADNAEALHKNTAASAAKGPIRGLMPQTAEKSPETNKMAAISKGSVNWNPKNK